MSQNRGIFFPRAAFAGLLFCVSIFSFASSNGNAQVVYGSIVGSVTDASGAVVPNATVSLVSEVTGQARDAQSDGEGRYSFVNVQPGQYRLKASSQGFRAYEATGIGVSPNAVTRMDLKLEVGQTTDTVTVDAATVALQTEKADTHTVLDSKDIAGMPLSGYRNYQELINLTPGATPAALQNSITDTPQRALQTHINGGNAQTNITRIDGAASVNVWLPHHVGYVTPSENIDVVNVTTTAADAEQGMAGASSITLVTKSGTNDLHGSVFEYHDDQHLKARNFFQTAGTSKPLSIYNSFGGTVGGPILKNKLFYFVGYEGTRQRQGSPGFYTIPTADQKAGNFSAAPKTILYDPLTGNADGTGRTPFQNNILPANRISSIAQKLQSYYPDPNVAGAGLTNNYIASGGPKLDRNNVDLKMNFSQSDKESIWGKYGRMWATSGGTAVFGVAGGSGLGGSDPGLGDTLVQVFSVGHSRTLSPNLLLDGVIAYERQGQSVLPNDYGKNYGQQLGIPNTNGPDPRQSGFPNIAITGYNGFGVPNWMPVTRVEESYTHSDNLTWTKGAHEFRFGFDLVRHHLNHWQPEVGQGPRGYLGFNGQETALKGGSAPNQFNAYAAFLLGYSDDTEKSLQYILMTGREWQFGWYARDRWQVTRNLTVNIGLRYEFYPLMTRAGKGIERYDPANNNVYLGGRGGQPDDVGITVSHKLFAPRVGLAYRVRENTVIRAGYGINYDPIPFSRPLRGWYPLTINAANVASGFGWSTTLAQGVPNPVGPDLSSGIVQLPANVSERSPWGGEVHRGYVQSYNFTVEHKFGGTLASVAYVGQHTVHLLADQDINSGYPGSGTKGLPYYALYGRSIPTQMWDGYLSSNYNSLQVAVTKNMSKGLLVKGAYTYSKAIDYTDDDGWASVGWNWGPVFQRNRAAAGFDRTHVFQAGWVYELPFGTGKKWVNSGFASKVLGGWTVNGLFSAYTGTPFTITSPGSSLNAPNNTQTADQIAPVQFLGHVGPGEHFYATSSFAGVTQQRFGSSGRNILRNTGVMNTDLDVSRHFKFRERYDLQFRAQFFNLPNTSHFNNLGTSALSVTNAQFMQITSSYGERQVRFGMRLGW